LEKPPTSKTTENHELRNYLNGFDQINLVQHGIPSPLHSKLKAVTCFEGKHFLALQFFSKENTCKAGMVNLVLPSYLWN